MLSVSEARALSSLFCFSALTNVFPDISGKLESETTITESISDPLTWSPVDPPQYEPGMGGGESNFRDAVIKLLDEDAVLKVLDEEDPVTLLHIREIV